jgi:LysM domain
MSAMRAVELPELPVLPAALPQDSAQTRAAVRWTAPLDPPASPSRHDAPPPPASPSPSPSPSRHDTPREQPTPRPHTTSPQTANPPLRLTRRGRVVVVVAAALVLAALSLVIASAALAASHPVSSRAAQQGLVQVTVRPGQSLWSVAENADPSADTRVVIQRIVDLNRLTGNVVFAGQHLWVPRA